MAGWCLIKDKALEFKKALKSGEINPGKLVDMGSKDRRVFLEKFVGKDNSQQVNALFESKLLLKNQKAGMIAWAKRVGGMTKESKRDLITRIEKLDTVLDPKSEKAFLQDLASQRLGVDVTTNEAKTIFDLTQKVQEAQSKRNPDTLGFPSENDRLDYGAKKIALFNYVNELKNQSSNLTLTDRLKPINYVKNVSDIAGMAKSTKASLDNSAIFRQGWRTIWTNPLIWLKNAGRSFADLVMTIKNKDKVIDGIMADIVSRPNYDRYVKAKLAIGTVEEAFPSSLPEKVPLLGRLFKASETAFTGFLYRQRADIFDAYINIMKRSGVDINDPKELGAIGKVINSLTGRGNLGGLEPVAGKFNNFFFSPRLLKSHLDVLSVQSLDKDITPFARKRAALNLTRVVLGTAGVLVLARALNKDSVETDSRSSDFGKIKVGNTRFDVTGGMASVLTLAARVISQSTKSSITGKITGLNTGEFGAPTSKDVIYNFFENKLSPLASVVKDWLQGEDFEGNKPTILGEAKNLLMPLPITNFQELSKDPHSAPILLALLADAVGIGTNTYGQTQKDWSKSTNKDIAQFKNAVGDKQFKEANNSYNTEFENWAQKIYRLPSYQNLSDDDKDSLIQKAKNSIQEKIFKRYNFKPKTVKSESNKKLDSLLPK